MYCHDIAFSANDFPVVLGLAEGKARVMKKLLMFLLLSLLSSGCAHTVSVHVDGEASQALQAGETFSFEVGGPQAVKGSERWQITTAALSRILLQQGLQPAAPDEKSDWLLLIDYGVGEPQSRDQFYVSPMAFGRSHRGGHRVGFGFGAHYRTRVITRIPVYLRVVGKSGDAPGSERSWRSSAVKIGTRGNLDRVLPALVWALRDVIGTSTTGSRIITVPLDPQEMQ